MKWHRTPTTDDGPQARWFHCAHIFGNQMILFGGHPHSVSNQRVWIYNLDIFSWYTVTTYGDIPTGTTFSSAADPNEGAMYVFQPSERPSDALLQWYRLHVPTRTWKAMPRQGEGCPAYEWKSVVCLVDRKIFLFNNVFQDIPVVDLDGDMKWHIMHTTGDYPTSPRKHFCAEGYPNIGERSIVVFGGEGEREFFNDLYILRLDTKTWYQVHYPPLSSSFSSLSLSPSSSSLYNNVNNTDKNNTSHSGVPMARYNATMTRFGKEMVLIGGYTQGGVSTNCNDVWVFNMDTLQWSEVIFDHNQKLLHPRNGHTTCKWRDGKAVVFGGYCGCYFSDVMILDTGLISNDESTFFSDIFHMFNCSLAVEYFNIN